MSLSPSPMRAADLMPSNERVAPAPPAPGRCLVVTALPLDDLQANRHGIFQRLRMLVEAMSLTGLALDIVCAQGAKAAAADPMACEHVAAQLREHWGIEARVLGLTRSVRDVRTPYILQQLMGCLSHRWSPSHRAAVAGGQIEQLTQALAHRPALVLAHRLGSMALLLDCPDLPPCVFDMDDIEHVVQQRRQGLGESARERWLSRAALPALVSLERQAVRRAWKTLVCAQDDARLLADVARVPPQRVAVVPNGVAPPPAGHTSQPSPAPAPVLLMIGIYSYEPNGEGARHFIDHVWPLVRQAAPQAEAWFVGAAPQAIGDAAHMPPGVKLLGFVDDIEAVYAQSSVVICPILTGGGTRVKLIEAAMRGKAIVSTTLGAEGLGFVDGTHARLCDDPQDFAQACVTLLASPDQAQALGQAAKDFAADRYDRGRIARTLAEQCRALLDSRPERAAQG